MDKPWLSVIIPCRNGERWLAATLQSIVDQKEPGIEVIFVDGSENDKSFEIAKSFSDQIDLKTFRRRDSSWMTKTNFGVEQATADQICMLHVDDVWLPGRCHYLRKWLSSQPEAAMQLHSCYIIDEAGRRLGIWRCPLPDDDRPVPGPVLFERLLVQNFIGIPTPTIRRDAYLAVGGLDTSLWYTADWDLYLKIGSTGNVYYHSLALAGYRIHRHALTVLGSRDSDDFRNQHQIVVNRHAHKLPAETKHHVLSTAMVSIRVNVVLAGLYGGGFSKLFVNIAGSCRTAYSLLALGPRGIREYFTYSRIADRVIPRLRALAMHRM